MCLLIIQMRRCRKLYFPVNFEEQTMNMRAESILTNPSAQARSTQICKLIADDVENELIRNASV